MFLIRNRPQPRGVCRPSSLASRSGGLGLGDRRAAALVGDPTVSRRPGGDHADLDRQVGPVAVAVLDGVHRRLGDGGLQRAPGAGTGRRPSAGDGLGHPVASPALVAGLARHRELRPGRCSASRRPSALASPSRRRQRSSVTRVMSSSCSSSGPMNSAELGRARRSISASPPRASPARRGHPREAEHLPLGVVRLDQPVAVEQHVSPGSRHGLASPRRPCPASAPAACRSPAARPPRPRCARTGGRGRRWRSAAGRWPGRGRRTGRSRTCWAGCRGTSSVVGALPAPRRATIRRGARPRRIVWVVAMTSAAGTPLSVTSPTTMTDGRRAAR